MNDLDITAAQRENFKQFMQQHKLKPSSWAKKAGIAEATIRHYLSGRNRSITIVNLEKLARVVGAKPENLLHSSKQSGENNNSLEIQKDLFVQTFADANKFIKSLNLELEPEAHANILLTWYELAQIHQENKLNPNSSEPFKELLQKIITNR